MVDRLLVKVCREAVEADFWPNVTTQGVATGPSYLPGPQGLTMGVYSGSGSPGKHSTSKYKTLIHQSKDRTSPGKHSTRGQKWSAIPQQVRYKRDTKTIQNISHRSAGASALVPDQSRSNSGLILTRPVAPGTTGLALLLPEQSSGGRRDRKE